MTWSRSFGLSFSRFCCAVLFFVAFPFFVSVGCAQLPGDLDPIVIEPGGPGNPPPPLTLSLSASPNPVLVGHEVTVIATAGGGAPDYTFAWGRACLVINEDPGELELEAPAFGDGNFPNVYKFCSPSSLETAKVGTIRVYCAVTDSANQAKEATIDIVVLPPDKIEIAIGDVQSTEHQGPNTPMTGLHTFAVLRGNELVGPCLSTTCAEKIWQIGTPEPNAWGFQGGVPTMTSSFHFLSPYIYDYRFYAFFNQAWWDALPVGAVVPGFDVFQRVKIDIPKCQGDPDELTSGQLRYRVIKISPTRVRFLVTNFP